MALTRQQHHKVILANSRHLRSGRLLRAPLATRLLVRRLSQTDRTWAHRPRLPGHPAHMDEGAGLEQSGPPGVECDTQDGPGPSPATDLIGEEPPNPDLQNRLATRERSSPSPRPQHPVTLGQDRASTVLGRLESEPLDDGIILSAATPPVVVETPLRSSRNQEDVGVPKDGKWDLVAAHEHRFCFQHRFVEWLLEYAERWMYPSDFKVRGAEDSEEEISVAEAALEAKLQV